VTSKYAVLIALLSLAPASYAADTSCAPTDPFQFICGPRSAEDLVLVPGTKWIISSSFVPGVGLYLIDAERGTWETATIQLRHDASFPNCTSAPDLATWVTHGLNLRATEKGRSTLYVVGHGAREAIEIFDVDANQKTPTVTWKGCVPLPEGQAANSVASLADGTIVATVPLALGVTFDEALGGKNSGLVARWSPGESRFEMLRGTELPYNNGIEVSADGRELFVASSGGRTIVAFSNENPSKQLRSTGILPFAPDNVHMGSDGRLLTAGMKVDEPACGGAEGMKDFEQLQKCPRGTIASAIDPGTMKDTVLVEAPAIATFSNATMVLPIGERFWIGTFSGDRIAH
jgi:hypothetical protein